MSARHLLGKPVAQAIEHTLIKRIKAQATRPELAAILVGENQASATYVRNKLSACERVGIRCTVHHLSAETSQVELLNLIESLNKAPHIHGILLQLPLPAPLQSEHLVQSIFASKDVDGLTAMNQGKLMIGDLSGFVPPTALGIFHLFSHYDIDCTGKNIVIVGRSPIVGRPLSVLLTQRAFGGNATVTLAHSATKDLAKICRSADILIAAIGRAEFFGREYLKPQSIAIDVGIHKAAASGKTPGLVGDICASAAESQCAMRSPVPGGVGPLTVACLLLNTAKAAGIVLEDSTS